MTMIEDPMIYDREYRKAMYEYTATIWAEMVKKDPAQHNYWRMKADKRMGRFKVVRSEGQEVLQE
jgi:CRISPR/Cas system-associated protein Cas7 (RAMP superfamily)